MGEHVAERRISSPVGEVPAWSLPCRSSGSPEAYDLAEDSLSRQRNG